MLIEWVLCSNKQVIEHLYKVIFFLEKSNFKLSKQKKIIHIRGLLLAYFQPKYINYFSWTLP